MTTIGPYEVRGEIGRGGMGRVLLARDIRLQRDVAIKSLAPRCADEGRRLARFRQESRIIAQLNHPHIAQIYHLLEHDGQMHLVLEYVPGRSLDERIAQDGALAAETALEIGAQVAGALQAAHARGIIHRDLKPANIRVTDEGVAKVLDFGIARFARRDDQTGAIPDLSGEPAPDPTTVVGTPGYMAPEQAEGRPVDARADVFSFGCVLYECLAGTPAFPGATAADRLAATLDGRPDETRLPASVPAEIRRLLRRCLDLQVQRRPASIGEVRAVLESALGRRSTPTPLEPGPRIADNLPALATSFVGREEELTALSRLLEEARLVTLTGAGGVGKTRLALHLARRVKGRFPDGVYLVELATTTRPELVPAAAAAVLGVTDRADTATPEALGERLAPTVTLLVIDNCERLLDAISNLVAQLLRSAPALRILATSREALRIPGEHAWPVPSLSVPDRDDPEAVAASEAVRLFTARARAARAGFELTEADAAAVARICRKLEGIPLAIELVAAQVRSLTPAQIDDRLDGRLRVLDLEARGVTERHRTLRAAMDWSYERLSGSEQKMLRTLSVFAGGWMLDGALAVCGPAGLVEEGGDLDELGTIDLLTRLIEKSMVLVEAGGEEPRYRLLSTVRQYAAERLEASEERRAAGERHLDFHLDLAERAAPGLVGGGQTALLARLEAEHENVLAALEHCARIEDGAERAMRLCGAMRWFWRLHGHFRTGYRACRHALALPHADAAPAARAAALQAAGAMALTLGDYEATTALATDALRLEQDLGSRDGIARSLNTLGNAAYYRGDLAEAKRRHEESLAIRRDLDDPAGIATSLNNLGNVASDRGHHDEARRLYEEALLLNRREGNRAWEAINLNNLGLLALYGGRLDEARRLHEESLARRRELADRHGIAESLGHLARIARHDGDLARARCLHAESLALRRDLGDRLGLAESLDETALLAARLDTVELAARLYGAAERLRTEIGAPRPQREQAEIDALLTGIRSGMDGDDFGELAAAGRALSLNETVVDALSWLTAAPCDHRRSCSEA